MTVKEFLEATITGKLSLEDQKKYLNDNPFGQNAVLLNSSERSIGEQKAQPVALADSSESNNTASKQLAEAVRYLYKQMPPPPTLPGAIDICGTGGSGLNRINTSTISAFLLAANGVQIAKHGNNAASGRFGSFDLLTALDVPVNLSNEELQLRYQEHNLAFLYARNFHPVMRAFAGVRAELKKPTFFNILGPLLSPVRAENQIIGTSNLKNARLLAEAAKELGKQRVIVVSGHDGLDEVTLSGPTHVVELNLGKIIEYDIQPSDFGIAEAKDFSEISGGTSEQNISIAISILKGEEKSRRTDLVLVNAALGLYLAGEVSNLKDGYKKAKTVLADKKAYKILEDYRRPSVLNKIVEATKNRKMPPLKPTSHKPVKYKGGLIAEIKRKSPSDQNINERVDILAQAKMYERAGASAISVLTEPKYFGGSLDDLSKIRQVVKLPILCKDFIISEKQIDAAKNAGADMVLLIVAILNEDDLARLYKYAESLGLEVLVEVHNRSELQSALAIKPKIIGINSRNLHDFSINPQSFDELNPLIPNNILTVAESGISSYADIPKAADGILVGTTLMKHPFPALKIKELNGKTIIKLCGIRTQQDAKLCESLGVDMIGINFVPRSKRKVTIAQAKQIISQCKNTIPVGVFENQAPTEINKISKETCVLAIQLSGMEADFEKYELPILKTIKPGQKKPERAFLALIDGPNPGSGKSFDHKTISKNEPNLIAGGVTVEIAKNLQKTKKPLGFDTASGIETDGSVDQEKIKAFARVASSLH